LHFRIGLWSSAVVSLFIECVRWFERAAAAPGTTCVANDPEKPRASIATGKGPKVPKGAKRRLLNGILRIVLVSHQPPSQSMRGVKVGQDDFIETAARRRRCGSSRDFCHVGSVEAERPEHHRQLPHIARTTLAPLSAPKRVPEYSVAPND
jgi:hypothetical protein